MDQVIEKICEVKVVPIITLREASKIIPVIQALQKGGLHIAEITLRTEEAIQAISIASKEFPEVLLGAGTVLTADQAGLAYENGAKFMVTPGFNPGVVDYCLAHQITIIPGLNSPTQIEQALERNITHVKFFPSEASGGISFINAIAGPYQHIRFMATGGINLDNLSHYLSNRYIFACGGSWMVKSELIEKERYEEIAGIVENTRAIIHRLS
jgi:2-dehydro-3-deoxyphosphogluconate aldolase/(4S)-4-hydroxy-2-oxoglutarate aldolase